MRTQSATSIHSVKAPTPGIQSPFWHVTTGIRPSASTSRFLLTYIYSSTGMLSTIGKGTHRLLQENTSSHTALTFSYIRSQLTSAQSRFALAATAQCKGSCNTSSRAHTVDKRSSEVVAQCSAFLSGDDYRPLFL